jgi:hypothetical protein
VSWATGVVVLSLVAGFGLTAAGWLTSGGIRSALTTSIGDASWDFSKSWASNVTIAGAILGTVLSAKILPATSTVVGSPNGYTALSLLFGALVVLAPLLFTASRTGKPDPKGPIYIGHGWAFLLASGVTLWAVLGQLSTLELVLFEAQHGKTLTLGAVLPIATVIGLAAILVALYGFRTVRLTVEPPSPTFSLDSIHGSAAMASKGWSVL